MKRLAATAFCAVLLFPLTAHTSHGAMTPAFRSVLEQVCRAYQQAGTLSAGIGATTRVQGEGMDQTIAFTSTLVVARSNRFALRFRGGYSGYNMTCVSDGSNLWLHVAALKKYTRKTAPKNLAALVKESTESGALLRRMVPVVPDFLSDDPLKIVLEGVTNTQMAADETVDGFPCRHLRFQQAQFDWDLWADAGATAVVRRIVVDMSKAYASRGKDMSMQTTYNFTGWQVDGPVADDAFAFTAPAGAKEVASLSEGDEEEPYPLLGKAAPDFEMELLDGGRTNLAALKGQVVVLDFWATWCAPCRLALPVVVKVTDADKAKGVAFFAVDDGEDADTIRPFLKKLQVACSVALDPTGAVSSLYSADSIPLTVIIDREGTVQAAHDGYSEDMASELKKELEAVLAGENLAAATLSNATAKAYEQRSGSIFQGAPMPSGTNAVTHADISRRMYAFNRRLLGDLYARIGLRDPAFDADVVKCLEAYAQLTSAVPGSPPADAQFAVLADLVKKGCKEPLILYLYGVQLRLKQDWNAAEPYLRRAMDGFLATNYPAYRKFMCAARLTQVYYEIPGKRSAYREWGGKMMQYLVDSATDGSYKPGEERMMIDAVEDQATAFDVFSYASLYASLAARTDAPPWVVKLAQGKSEVKLAWKERGGGFANTVSEQGWAGFKKHLETASEAFTAAWEANPKEPHPAAYMIEVEMGMGDGPAMRKWFDRAVAAQLDYWPAYEQILWAMRPRWFGTHEEMYDFGLECLNTRRFDTDVPFNFVQALIDIGEDTTGWRDEFSEPGRYEKLADLFQGYVAATNRPYDASLYRSYYAVAAWACGDKAKAREMLAAVSNNIAPAVCSRLKFDAKAMVADLAAGDVPPGSAALARFEKLAASSNLDGATRSAVAERLFVLRAESNLAAGAWADIMPAEELAGWDIVKGTWTAGNGTVRGGTDTEGYADLLSKIDVGVDFEVRGTIRFVKAVNHREQGGVSLGKQDREGTRVALRIRKEGDMVKVECDQIYHGKGVFVPIPAADKYDVVIQYFGGHVTAYVNGKAVSVNTDPKKDPDAAWNGRIGLYAYQNNHAEMTTDYSGFKVRRLTAMPPGFDTGTLAAEKP